MCDLLDRWPTLEQLQKAPVSRLRQFFHRHHCRQAKLIATRIEEIGTARPALKDRAIVEVQASVVPVLVQVLRTLRSGIEKLDRQMAEAVAEHPDYYLYQSLPGARTGDGAATARRHGNPTRALQQRPGAASLQRYRAGYGTERQEQVGTLALALSQVSAPELP